MVITKRLLLDRDRLANALDIPSGWVVPVFTDGRTAAAFVERWAAATFGFAPRVSLQKPGLHLVKVLTSEGVSFSPSKNKGLGRQAAASREIDSHLQQFERFVVVDMRQFPMITLFELSLDVVNRLIAESPEVSCRRFDGIVQIASQR